MSSWRTEWERRIQLVSIIPIVCTSVKKNVKCKCRDPPKTIETRRDQRVTTTPQLSGAIYNCTKCNE